MKKATAKGKAKSKAGKKEPPQKKPVKATKAQLKAAEEARLAKARNRDKMVADATLR